jgi:hypothetical protein
MTGRPAITQARFDVHCENDPPDALPGVDEYLNIMIFKYFVFKTLSGRRGVSTERREGRFYT